MNSPFDQWSKISFHAARVEKFHVPPKSLTTIPIATSKTLIGKIIQMVRRTRPAQITNFIKYSINFIMDKYIIIADNTFVNFTTE